MFNHRTYKHYKLKETMENGRHFLKKSKQQSHVIFIEKLTNKNQLSAKFPVNSGFLLLRNNSDKINYLIPQNMGLDETTL